MQVIKIILQAISIPVIAAAIVAGVVALLIWFIFSALINAISESRLSKEEMKGIYLEELRDKRHEHKKSKKVFVDRNGQYVDLDEMESRLGGN